jgi:hypothetical protein
VNKDNRTRGEFKACEAGLQIGIEVSNAERMIDYPAREGGASAGVD